MALDSFDDFAARIAAGYGRWQPFYGERQTAGTSTMLGGSTLNPHFCATTEALPSLPSGVTAYIPTAVYAASSVSAPWVLAKLIDFGSIDIGTNVFTSGSSMPTVTELGVSRVMASPVLAIAETALSANGAPTLSITYTDQDGNTGRTTSAQSINTATVIGSGAFVIMTFTGARAVTGATRTSGTSVSGTIRFYGLIPIAFMVMTGTGGASRNLLTHHFNPIRLGAGDDVRMIQFFTTATAYVGGMFVVGDN